MKRLILLICIAAVIIFSSVFFLSRSIANAQSAYVQSLIVPTTAPMLTDKPATHPSLQSMAEQAK